MSFKRGRGILRIGVAMLDIGDDAALPDDGCKAALHSQSRGDGAVPKASMSGWNFRIFVRRSRVPASILLELLVVGGIAMMLGAAGLGQGSATAQ